MLVRVITSPVAEPITLAEARLQLRIDGGSHPDDALITRLISAARAWAEKHTGLALAPQTWEAALNAFFSAAVLPGGAVNSIVSVKYVEPVAGVETVLSPTVYALDSFAGSISLAYGQAWPAIRAIPHGVRIRYTLAGAVDEDVRAAIYLVVGHLYANRENSSGSEVFSVPMGAESLLALSRVNLGV